MSFFCLKKTCFLPILVGFTPASLPLELSWLLLDRQPNVGGSQTQAKKKYVQLDDNGFGGLRGSTWDSRGFEGIKRI